MFELYFIWTFFFFWGIILRVSTECLCSCKISHLLLISAGLITKQVPDHIYVWESFFPLETRILEYVKKPKNIGKANRWTAGATCLSKYPTRIVLKPNQEIWVSKTNHENACWAGRAELTPLIWAGVRVLLSCVRKAYLKAVGEACSKWSERVVGKKI